MIETLAEHRCFDGVQGWYRHASVECRAPMRFAVYRPPQATRGPVPVLYWLSGLTCTEETFAIKAGAQGLFGHSMGGHGALVCGLRNPGLYRPVSAFAPIAAPMQCPWGLKAFGGYLGEDRTAWADYDASVRVARRPRGDWLLIDQGSADRFLAEQLQPEVFADAARRAGQPFDLRFHAERLGA